uniref:Uncharacterized protein n=1 Tax=Siphoviridae sp. ctq8D8 TaxID=2827944 RepID=A0A8S5SMK1_9CAUD|nr:MAG TPA: hypothetical protein [Siphoviridae sp. ctq8D8]
MVLQRKVRYDGIHVPTFPRYFAAGLSASEHRPLRRSPQGLSDRGARRRRRYVDVPARIGTGSPAQLGQAGPVGAPAADPSPSLGASDLVSVLRVLPGFSGSFQVHPPRM